MGQTISSEGLTNCVYETILNRKGKISSATNEIIVVINNWRSTFSGGMESAILMWEQCIIPSLLNGCGNWTKMCEKSVKILNDIQNLFLLKALQMGQGTRKVALLWETGLLDMRLRVWKEMLFLLIHIKNLDPDSLANQFYREQLKENWPGLVSECKFICEKLGLKDLTFTNEENIKIKINNACVKINEKWLRIKAQGKAKCARILRDPYGKKSYISKNKISDVREIFRTRTFMQPFSQNYKHSNMYEKTNWLCACMERKESEDHLLSGNCAVYGDLIDEKFCADNDEELVSLFKSILDRRDKEM